MKITRIDTTPVTVPMIAPLRWSMGVETGTTRTLIQLQTDEGITGLGETYGGSPTIAAIKMAEPLLAGEDPLEVGRIAHKLTVYRCNYESHVPAHVLGGLEIACWDAAGKALGRPVASLLGGATRTALPFAAYLFFRYPDGQGRYEVATPEQMLASAESLVEAHGFKTLKVKGGVLPPSEEVRAVRLLRERFGPSMQIRFDPNAAWSVETSIRYGRQLVELDIEFLEDPTWNIEGMSMARRDVPIPFATNMCVVDWPHIPPAVRLHAVDIILGDVHYWGGLAANRRLASLCETFQLGFSLHSDRELGISTAAMLHLAAATPYAKYALDSHYHDQADDVITAPFRYEDGELRLPAGMGLGVSLDADQVAKYHDYWRAHGEVAEVYDPHRAGWIPNLPIF